MNLSLKIDWASVEEMQEHTGVGRVLGSAP
jgi:hypothetical protein